MKRKPDALKPDDENELESSPRQRRQKPGDVARGEHADPEQFQPEHRVRDVAFHDDEKGEQKSAAAELPDHRRIPPSHARSAIGLDRICEADQHQNEPRGEEYVPWDVEALVLADGGRLVEHQVRPHSPEDPERHAHQEDGAPVYRGKDAAHEQPHEHAGQNADLVDAHGEASLLRRKGIGEDRRGVRHQERAAHGLDDTEEDDLQRRPVALPLHEEAHDRAQGEDGKPGVVQAHAAVHI